VLRSLRLRPGDEMIVLSHVYGAVRNTVRYVADRAGATMVEVAMPFPRAEPDEVIAGIVAAVTPRTRIAVLDHITSHSALVLPLAEMVAACHAAGVPVLVDGAHAPGQVALDLGRINADWYAGNCHKWLNAPKGCAFLHARADRQEDLHPVTISHGYEKGYLAEFDWAGTWDPSAFLSVAPAIDFHNRLGGTALQARNIALAAEAAGMLAGRFGTETSLGNGTGGSMALVRLPWQTKAGHEDALALRQDLLHAGTDVPVYAEDGRMWIRISAQAYNEMDDYRQLVDLIEPALLNRNGVAQ
jgi:isopenicillin-N epimerase